MFMLTKFKHYGWDICVFLAIFISMFIFFTGAHPLIIYDGDDWANLSHMRHFIPMWHGFNPIKILPETLMPLVGYLSGYVVTPIVKNYVVSVTIVSALLVTWIPEIRNESFDRVSPIIYFQEQPTAV